MILGASHTRVKAAEWNIDKLLKTMWNLYCDSSSGICIKILDVKLLLKVCVSPLNRKRT